MYSFKDRLPAAQDLPKWYELRQFYENDPFREAIRLKADPSLLPSVYSSLGDAYLNLRQDSDAVAAFQEAIRLKPDHAAYHYNLGLTYATMGRKDQALQVYRTLVSMDASLAEQLGQD